jgi:hypothetical protein
MGGMATDNFTDHPKVYVGATEEYLVKELEMFGAVKWFDFWYGKTQRHSSRLFVSRNSGLSFTRR